MSLAPLLMFAIGNESRGDDALGPLLARQLITGLDAAKVELIEEFQLQVENTLDMQSRELVLFIDAGHDTAAPFSFYRAPPRALTGHTTHAVAPEALLGVFSQVHSTAPPPAFVLCVAGSAFELGEPLSPTAENHLKQALAFARELMDEPVPERWHAIAATSADTSMHEALI